MEFMGRGWACGSTRVDGSDLVLTHTDDVGLHVGDGLSIAIAGVRTPREAASVATRFGLLRQSDTIVRKAAHGTPAGSNIGVELREPFADWQQAALHLNRIMTRSIDLRVAVAGDSAAIERLRGTRAIDHPDAHAADDAEILQWATGTIAYMLNYGVGPVEHVIIPLWGFSSEGAPIDAPGQWRTMVLPATMLATAYLELTEYVVEEKHTLRYCADCGRVFLVADPRQQYCNAACAARMRYRRKVERQRAAII